MAQLKLIEGEIERNRGIDRAERKSVDWVRAMRNVAKIVARQQGEVSSADIREICEQSDYWPHSPAAWGALFRGGEFEHTGRYEKARHKDGHARRVGIWRLKDG